MKAPLNLLALFVSAAHAAGIKEREVQACLCSGMQQEVSMPSGGYADCVSDKHAIEVDKSQKWAESIGQALYYAQQTGKRAKVFMYCKTETGSACIGHRLRFEMTVRQFSLPIELEAYSETEIRAICKVKN